MISINDIKSGKILVEVNAFRRRHVIQLTSPLRKRKLRYVNKTHIDVTIEEIDPKRRNFRKRNLCFEEEELLRNNNCLPPWFKKPRINEIFDWYILNKVRK